jgi:hypothetical protein
MRKYGLFLASSALILMSVAWVEGQQGGDKKKGGFGSGFGGIFGGFGQRQSPLDLLNRDDVKKELDVTDEQAEKIPAEVMNAIAKVLNETQFKRFKQIELQKRGNHAFKDEGLQKALNMNADQKKSINSLLEDSDKELADLRKAAFKGGFKAGTGTEKIDNATKETKEKIYTVLNKDQRKAYREMIGTEFKFAAPPAFVFPTPGADKKVEPKKTDK